MRKGGIHAAWLFAATPPLLRFPADGVAFLGDYWPPREPLTKCPLQYTGPHYKLIHRRVMGVSSSAGGSTSAASAARTRKNVEASGVAAGGSYNVHEC